MIHLYDGKHRVFSEVRAEDDETVVSLKVTTETDCLLCEVQIGAKETVVALKITTEKDCLFL